MRILLTVAYDGTAYHGWQAQAHEQKTIEGALNTSLSRVTGEEITVIGASRTDAGVHALGNLCVFDTSCPIPPDKFVPALNSVLPDDIRITDSRIVDGGFHPRRINMRKTYCYRLVHSDICSPMDRLYRHHIYGPLDTDAMSEAAGAFVGEYDFAAFCAAGSQAETTVRTVYDASVRVTGESDFLIPTSYPTFFNEDAGRYSEYIDMYITGNGFLYNMVRIIAGTLLEVGRGRIAAADIPDIIASKDRARSGPTLPAHGLWLLGYELPDNICRIKINR